MITIKIKEFMVPVGIITDKPPLLIPDLSSFYGLELIFRAVKLA